MLYVLLSPVSLVLLFVLKTLSCIHIIKFFKVFNSLTAGMLTFSLYSLIDIIIKNWDVRKYKLTMY